MFNREFMTERKGSHAIYVGDTIVDLILCTGKGSPSSFSHQRQGVLIHIYRHQKDGCPERRPKVKAGKHGSSVLAVQYAQQFPS
jgi:hypothetical protein